MTKIRDLEILPVNFRHEKEFLNNKNLNTWESIHKLTDMQISHLLQQKSLCTESRLKKIRAISIFISELKINPHHAYLLLHSGIGSIKALSYLTPHNLELKIGRFERILGVKKGEKINLSILKDWIDKAKIICN